MTNLTVPSLRNRDFGTVNLVFACFIEVHRSNPNPKQLEVTLIDHYDVLGGKIRHPNPLLQCMTLYTAKKHLVVLTIVGLPQLQLSCMLSIGSADCVCRA